MTRSTTPHPNRRSVLGALLCATSMPSVLWAQAATAPAADAVTDTAAPFSFDMLIDRMRARAAAPDAPPALLDTFLENLSYDGYRNIRFRRDAVRWMDTDLAFQVSSFHPGWLYKEPVVVHEIVAGRARPMTFSTDDFEYLNDLADLVPDEAELPGIAGLKINHPLNRADIFDELITFLGASYFRALGRGNSYGLSARGLAIDTWLQGAEEFPRFSEFWLERPVDGAQALTLYAALDSASVTGAYRFVITPGADTIVDVEAHLFFRKAVRQLGLGPLTSMFYFAEHSERRFDDYRPQVHDSDALKIIRKDGDVLLRPLNNPPRVANSYFAEANIDRFGLIQRDRAYESYQDAGAQYHNRPSVMIEPVGDWGAGAIRLVEIPADLEIEDNIVLFWVPDAAPQAGDSRSYRYRMHWGALPPNTEDDLAWVKGTRTGVGGPSGVPIKNDNLRKFVVDFEGGLLGTSPEDTELTPVVGVSAGDVQGVVLHKVSESGASTGLWRLVIDIDGQDHDLIELSAHVAGHGRKLTETWLFQWVRDVAAAPAAEPADASSIQTEGGSEIVEN